MAPYWVPDTGIRQAEISKHSSSGKSLRHLASSKCVNNLMGISCKVLNVNADKLGGGDIQNKTAASNDTSSFFHPSPYPLDT